MNSLFYTILQGLIVALMITAWIIYNFYQFYNGLTLWIIEGLLWYGFVFNLKNIFESK